MWFDGQRQPNTIYVANTSRGKDSTAMLRAIQLMGWPLDMICSVDIWFDDETPAELPPMVAFKDEYDRKVQDWFGVPVTRLCATKRERERDGSPDGECHSRRLTYCGLFYERYYTKRHGWHINGFPCTAHGWCKRLKDTAKHRDSFQTDLRGHLLSQDQPRERERDGSSSTRIYGFPIVKGTWCNSDLKRSALQDSQIRYAAGVQENSSWQHQRVSLEEGKLVPGSAQGGIARQPSPRCPRTTGRR